MAPIFKLTTKVRTVVDNSATFLKAQKELRSSQVLVGIPAEKAPRTSEEAKGMPINNAALGYIHNYGMPSQNIPARPFLEPGIKNAGSQITNYFGKAGVAALEGNTSGVLKNLTAAGIVAASSVRAKINSGPFEPLKASTLAARHRRGRTGEKPLIDTAQLLRSISFILRKQ
jgi:hypothetical protein